MLKNFFINKRFLKFCCENYLTLLEGTFEQINESLKHKFFDNKSTFLVIKRPLNVVIFIMEDSYGGYLTIACSRKI